MTSRSTVLSTSKSPARTLAAAAVSCTLVIALAGCATPAHEAPTRMSAPASGITSAACFAAIEPEDFVGYYDYVLYGTYLGASDPFLVQSADGNDHSYFIDYRFAVAKAYRGAILSDDKTEDGLPIITVRIEGGQGPTLDTYVSTWPSFVDDTSYLLFLHKDASDDRFDTAGTYYYISGGNEAWTELEPGVFSGSGEGTVTESEIIDMIGSPTDAAMNANPGSWTLEDILADIESAYRAGELDESYLMNLMKQMSARISDAEQPSDGKTVYI